MWYSVTRRVSFHTAIACVVCITCVCRREQDPPEDLGKAGVAKRRYVRENVTGHVGRARDHIDDHAAALQSAGTTGETGLRDGSHVSTEIRRPVDIQMIRTATTRFFPGRLTRVFIIVNILFCPAVMLSVHNATCNIHPIDCVADTNVPYTVVFRRCLLYLVVSGFPPGRGRRRFRNDNFGKLGRQNARNRVRTQQRPSSDDRRNCVRTPSFTICRPRVRRLAVCGPCLSGRLEIGKATRVPPQTTTAFRPFCEPSVR